MKKLFVVAALALVMVSCTDNQRAKSFGGTYSVDLPAGEKLVNVTWKGESDLWYLTRKMTAKDSAETYTFKQDKGSVLNLTGNGEVILKESK
jgi:hypothetical protein